MRYVLPIISVISLFLMVSFNKPEAVLTKDSPYLIVEVDSVDGKLVKWNPKIMHPYQGKEYEVYRVNNDDLGVDTCGWNYYRSEQVEMKVFCFYDLPVGCAKEVMFNIRTGAFYVTNWYNCTGNEGELVYKTLDFNKLTVQFKDQEGEQLVKLRKIWDPEHPSDTPYILKYVPEEIELDFLPTSR